MAHRLPDGGAKLQAQRMEITNKISQIKKAPPPNLTTHGMAGDSASASAQKKVMSAYKGQGRRLPYTSLHFQLFQKGINLQARLLTSGVVEQLHR